MSSKKTNIIDAIWDFFCSLKLTIATLILLAITSIIGTVVQQGKSPQEYLQEYSETTYRVLSALNFTDMYHSWWFLGLLEIFALNLIACSIKRFPKVWKTVHEPVLAPAESFYRTLPNSEEVVVKGEGIEALRERAAALLGKAFATPVVTAGEEGEVHLFAQKMPWARFGVYVTHLSIIIIFVGAIIGSLWGYKAFVNIVEGTATDKVWARGASEPIDLGFQVRCDDFSVSFYGGGGGGRPKEFKSVLTVIDGGKTVVDQRPIIVNDPLTYKGITFYQSSYGPTGEPTIKLRVKVRASGEVKELAGRQGQRLMLPGGGSVRVVDSTEAFQDFGPAARIEVTPPQGEARSFVVLKAFPEFDAQRGGDYIFSLLDMEQRYYTGLQVAKDPGVWVVWLGCAMLVLGSMTAFFLSHRRIWVTLLPLAGGKVGVKIGGSAHRNQPAFEIFFDDLKKQFRDELK
ncbi:cytochrome c biogenesis protein ResB [Desulfuromonas carbonis]|uniref:cytochrome c biogenesis protein ResB n=1 Tax=Desulfuromonas sp. DDH964 TaxID=1823759 RepID=UPI00078CD22A|nr:cytochrome c biogenesis protein ResB [Desulfuromonas sp. DDH964]AMV73898.1 ResB-like family cytochrome c biogenesis protein [Desulfuromonas sp. DDH964]